MAPLYINNTFRLSFPFKDNEIFFSSTINEFCQFPSNLIIFIRKFTDEWIYYRSVIIVLQY